MKNPSPPPLTLSPPSSASQLLTAQATYHPLLYLTLFSLPRPRPPLPSAPSPAHPQGQDVGGSYQEADGAEEINDATPPRQIQFQNIPALGNQPARCGAVWGGMGWGGVGVGWSAECGRGGWEHSCAAV